ncbi:Rrp15p-domain-containing protein [Xylariaceae sp. FL0804]|nr:Rrp15p-domain-containing protein [Xylariaceae sp. FL0804]
MPGSDSKKRSLQETVARPRPQKKQRKEKQGISRHSNDPHHTAPKPEFQPVSLLDSDEDLDDAAAEDVSSVASRLSSDSEEDQESRSVPPLRKKRPTGPKKSSKGASSNRVSNERAFSASEEEEDQEIEEGDNHDEDDDDHDDDHDAAEPSDYSDAEASEDVGGGGGGDGGPPRKARSKRNDPDAFATSISKILSTKLSSARRADPVLSRSADAQRAARDAVDATLEAKARRHLREQKKLALEKGRVRDVLAGTVATGRSSKKPAAGAAEQPLGDDEGEGGRSTGEVLQAEKRLRKTAHRGVVMLFRAVREAQERAVEAERDARKDGVFGVARREEKVNEMSRQGFLDLIAGGGGKTQKGALGEA